MSDMRWRRHHPHLPIVAPRQVNTENAMPSRTVPAQQLSDAGEDLRLAAAVNAEIALLKADFQNASDAADAYCAEIAALTEQRDRAMKVVEAARSLKFGAYPAHGSGFVSIVTEGNLTELADALAALDAGPEGQ